MASEFTMSQILSNREVYIFGGLMLSVFISLPFLHTLESIRMFYVGVVRLAGVLLGQSDDLCQGEER